jgi:hypothetical protein
LRAPPIGHLDVLDTRLLHHWTYERAVRRADPEREMGYVLHAYLEVVTRRRPNLCLVAGFGEAAQPGGGVPVAVET